MKLLPLLVLFFGCFRVPYPHDNAMEELVEDVIMEETGIDIDFTGSTPEVKDEL